jgi:perosamine synthetase
MTRSGCAALITALRATNVPLRSEVIMPAICCPSVLFAIQLSGYKVVLADVELDTFNMNRAQLDSCITPNTRAVVAVHGFGRYCEIDVLAEFSKEKQLILIEDACLAQGGSYLEMPLGSFGDVSIVSFGYDKPVDCNYGGALLTNDDAIYQAANRFVSENLFFSYNPRPECDSKILSKLERLDEAVQQRLQNIRIFETEINQDFILKPAEGHDIVYWRYPCLVDGDRDKLVERANSCGLIFTTHYKNLAGLTTGVNLPNADYIASHIFNLFVRPETPQHQIEDSIDFLNSYVP